MSFAQRKERPKALHNSTANTVKNEEGNKNSSNKHSNKRNNKQVNNNITSKQNKSKSRDRTLTQRYATNADRRYWSAQRLLSPATHRQAHRHTDGRYKRLLSQVLRIYWPAGRLPTAPAQPNNKNPRSGNTETDGDRDLDIIKLIKQQYDRGPT